LLKLVINPDGQKLTGAQMAYKQLTLEQRYEIKAFMQAGFSMLSISKLIGVNKSTVSREVKRNSGQRGYRAKQAHSKALSRQKQAPRHIRFTEDIKALAEKYIRLDFSPEQVSGHLMREYDIKISIETLYQHVWANKVLAGDLYLHLRCSSKKKRKRYGGNDRRGQIPDRVSIDQRPSIVGSKERIGDWEVDTVIGKNHKGALVTAVERVTKFTCIKHVKNRTAELVSQALIEMLHPYSDKVFTITYDNGKEFSMHVKISKALEADGYFAHPYHSWERGLNENTNGLIRQYLPKKTSFENVKEMDIQFIEQRLNMRPRKSLNYQTPNELFLETNVALGT
jgi:IS30 family transposase